MKKPTIRIKSVLLCLLLLFALTACSESESLPLGTGNHYYYPKDETEETETAETTSQDNLFLIVMNNTAEEVLHLYNYEDGLEYQYRYGLDTRFYDKYGNYETGAKFTPGKAVWIGHVDADGRLIEMGFSDQVWEYDDITRFSTDTDIGMLKIADSKYSYGSEAFSFSGDEIIDFGSITQDDELSVVGIGKKILSVNVTTGHGTLELTNTDLFEGSFLQLNKDIFTIITKDMTMDLPEGTYQLAVANDGWGGTEEITIKRGETTTISLDELKGDGPSYGTILFTIDTEGALLYIDDVQVDYSEPITLKYGKHSLAVVSDDYDEWDRTLYVNSAEATIAISLADDDVEDDTESTESSTESTESSSESSTESSSESTSESGSTTDSDSTTDVQSLKDYLSTLSSLIDSLL